MMTLLGRRLTFRCDLLGFTSINFGARTNLTIARSRLRRMIMSHPNLDVVVSWGAVNGNMIQRFLFRLC